MIGHVRLIITDLQRGIIQKGINFVQNFILAFTFVSLFLFSSESVELKQYATKLAISGARWLRVMIARFSVSRICSCLVHSSASSAPFLVQFNMFILVISSDCIILFASSRLFIPNLFIHSRSMLIFF